MANNAYSIFSPLAQKFFQNPTNQTYLDSGGQIYYAQQPSGDIYYAGNQPGVIAANTTTELPRVGLGGGPPSEGTVQIGSEAPPPAPPPVDPYAEQKNLINQGYGTYEQSLNQMLNEGLPGSRTALEGIVRGQYASGLADYAGQRTQGLQDIATAGQKIETQKVKSLKDIAANIRNQMMAGQVYLGARGAADSSAANQYSYAMNKIGSQQRGDLINQATQLHADLQDKEFKLNNIYNTEVNKLKADVDTKINSIGQWFADAQNQIRQMQGQIGVNKGKDLATISQNALQYAMQQMQAVQQEARDQRARLDTWALNNNTTLQGYINTVKDITSQLNTNLVNPLSSMNRQYMAQQAPRAVANPAPAANYENDRWWIPLG